MKILIAVDGSAHSDAAVRFARTFAWPKDTKAILISAVPWPAMVPAEVYVPATEVQERLIEEQTKAHREIVSRAERALGESGLVVDARVVQGDPREVIVRVATEEGADLVVVGSHGRTGLAKLLVGSVASYVVGHAPGSVMVVKQGRKAE